MLILFFTFIPYLYISIYATPSVQNSININTALKKCVWLVSILLHIFIEREKVLDQSPMCNLNC